MWFFDNSNICPPQEEYHFAYGDMCISVQNNQLSVTPDYAAATNYLTEVASTKTLNNCHLALSDSLIVAHNGDLILHLGHLTITILSDRAVLAPLLQWDGDPSSEFDQLNSHFVRWHKMKALW
jgi:hypothetical protein